MIGTLNINSLAPKFDYLSEVIGRNLDIFTLQVTNIDPSFPSQQFMLGSYSEPYRLDRDRDGGGSWFMSGKTSLVKNSQSTNSLNMWRGCFLRYVWESLNCFSLAVLDCYRGVKIIQSNQIKSNNLFQVEDKLKK